MEGVERIQRTINRESVDGPPVDLWLTPEVLADLQRHTGETDELAVSRALGLDRIAWVSAPYLNGDPPIDKGGRDPWGATFKQVKSGKATYLEVDRHPLAELDEVDELMAYDWPDPDRFDYAEGKAQAVRAREFGFATMGPWVSHFEIFCRMRGLESALMDLIADPEYVETALDKIDTIQTEMLTRFLETTGDTLDMVLISDDIGTQESQLISVEHWMTHLKPRLTRWCDRIHSHGQKVAFHTDGAVRPFIPHLIECGVDILNPIQHVCPGMERAELNRDFGEKLVFYGGVENQHVLPYGTTDDVRREVRACMETLGDGGGYIVCSCHNIQPGTPVENILTMIETVREGR